VLATVAIVSMAGQPGASAAPVGEGMLRLAHLSPDTPAVDVALTPVPAGRDVVTDPGPDIADDLAYGSGVWTGALRHRDPGPLLPRIT